DVVLAQRRNGVRDMAAGVAGQRVGKGELVGVVVVFAAGALEPGVVGAEGQPIERAAVPAELDRVVPGRGDLAMAAFGALEGPGRAQRVLVVQAPVAAEGQLEIGRAPCRERELSTGDGAETVY